MSAHRRESERIAAADELRKSRQKSMWLMRQELRLEDVPLCGTYDRLGPDLVRACVYAWATTGDWDLVCDMTGLQRMEARRCMEREGAREMVALMMEEGTWPEGAPTGRRVKRAD